MNAELVSCVIAVYNGERYLAEAIDSALAQSHSSIEVIIADDGSTDGTPGIAQGYDDRVRYFRQENAGPSAARNLGIDHARGGSIGFLDADDRWTREKIELQLARIRATEGVGAIFGHAQNFWVDELKHEAEKFKDHRIARPLPAYVAGSMLVTCEALDRIGRFDAKLRHSEIEDWVLRARGAGVGVDLMEEVLLERRLHPQNMSRNQAADSREEYLRLIKKSLDQKRGR